MQSISYFMKQFYSIAQLNRSHKLFNNSFSLHVMLLLLFRLRRSLNLLPYSDLCCTQFVNFLFSFFFERMWDSRKWYRIPQTVLSAAAPVQTSTCVLLPFCRCLMEDLKRSFVTYLHKNKVYTAIWNCCNSFRIALNSVASGWRENLKVILVSSLISSP